MRAGSILAAVALMSVASVARAQEGPTPLVSDQEHQKLLDLLDESQDRVLGLISGLTDEQWSFRESPDRWSTAECVEHIVRSQSASLESLEQLIAGAPDPEWFSRTQGKTSLLERYIPNPMPQGQGGARAPEEIRPTEEWTRGDGIRKLYDSYGRARATIETMDRNIKDRTSESSVEAFGWLNAYHSLLIIPLHAMRHSQQIARIQAHPSYPDRPKPSVTAEPDPTLTDEEFAALIQDIDDGQDTLLGLISGLSDEQWEFRENPNRWSIGECVEHITRTQRAVVEGLAFSFRGPPNPRWYEETRGKIDLVRRTVLTRNPGGSGSTFSAPGEVAPSQNWDRARGFREFYQTHGTLRAYIETMPRDIKSRTMLNPFPEIGMLNGYDWLTLTALHVLRHSKQVAEVKADSGFPKTLSD